jgi:hypothetical protein
VIILVVTVLLYNINPTLHNFSHLSIIPKFLSPSSSRPKDVRHIETASAAAWVLKDGAYVIGSYLPRFTTIDVLGSASDPNFVTAQLPDGQSVTLAASDLGSGDGMSARMRWCQEQTEAYPFNGEILKKLRTGRNRAIIINSGGNEAVAKFHNAGGSVVSIFIGSNSQAAIDNFPDGDYQLEFATGTGWSRRCGAFVQRMHTQRFPTVDTFTSGDETEIVQGRRMLVPYRTTMTYTITPVENGNVQTESMDQDDFIRD